ncbi:2-hydroxyglutaryl-CoA dehydratase [Iocasia frigidifontis]|uniref:2-hydroxyglutaryl-CoA dehydratase n=1 Tax=Iocasia fonsfrigidae TaxID=2682810 RepID=A0A8A7KG38_9FIRM|nr:acyl-CoA dehydratase activase-related protein [Iocasia fonsfrigidae]QTL98479.1 2-hydroxyglutaryl-CoA dehydratase [Iocasia fonsfrigidae]
MCRKIGIPRALMYHYYYPSWETFFEELGFEVILSPETNKEILDKGVKMAVDDICLPFKVFFGHVRELVERVDYLFIPKFISLGKNNCVCPKFMGLPDMVKAIFAQYPPILAPVIDLRYLLFPMRRIVYALGKRLGANMWQIEKAFYKAKKKHEKFLKVQQQGIMLDEAMKIVNNKIKFDKNKKDNNYPITIALLGHSYITNDHCLSMNIIKHLQDLKVNVITLEMFEPAVLEREADRQDKKLFWYYNRHVMGSAYHLIYNKRVNGLIQLTAFGCGPDSLVKELINLRGKKRGVSILNINIDEHSGEAGLLTRLEAFVDLVERREMA